MPSLPEDASSPSTYHGSIAVRSSSPTPPTVVTPTSGKRNSAKTSNQARSRSKSWERRSATTSARSAIAKCGSRNRSWSAVPQRTNGAEYGCSAKRATRARTSSAWTSAMSGCGAISKPRSSSSPSRPRSASGLYSLSTQNSDRWVFPVMSVSRCRSDRSTTHGRCSDPGSSASRAISAKAISSSYSVSGRPSSTRGAWLVAPTNRPENR